MPLGTVKKSQTPSPYFLVIELPRIPAYCPKICRKNNSCLPCVRVCYQLFEFKDSFIDSFEALFVLLFRYLFLISLRIVFSLKLHYFFTIFHYFIVFASELSNARISGFANTFARSSGSISSATVALLFSCCTCICGSRFFFS